MARFLGKRSVLLTLLFIMAVVVLMVVTTSERVQVSPVEKVLRDLTSPIEGAIMKVSQSSKNYIDSLLSFRQLKKQNEDLNNQVSDLENQVSQLKGYQMENMRLRELLQFKDSIRGQLKMEPASIIGRDLSNWLNTVTINKGLNDGIRKDMAVVNQKGLVGRVMAVSNSTAEVLLIVDSRSAVGGLDQITRTSGIVEGVGGDSGLVRMIHLPKDAAIRKNQVVVSSGLGGIFPKDLRIGRVYSVESEPNGLLKSALILPDVDFNQLEEVYIITGEGAPASGNTQGGSR